MAKQKMTYADLVNEGAEAYFRQLLSIGWVNEWHDDDIEVLQDALKETENKYMLFCLSEYTFNPEGISSADDYKNVILDMCDAFGIELKPEEITATDDGADIIISVETETGKADWRFTQTDTWAHEDIFDFINDELLEALDEEKIIYPLPPADTTLELVFVRPEVLDQAIDSGIIPDDDFFVG